MAPAEFTLLAPPTSVFAPRRLLQAEPGDGFCRSDLDAAADTQGLDSQHKGSGTRTGSDLIPHGHRTREGEEGERWNEKRRQWLDRENSGVVVNSVPVSSSHHQGASDEQDPATHTAVYTDC